ncbi:RNA-binding protein [Candidatus Kirkpatrickella diaphorinae]|uniref:RNA-binding protein n=1 Tax=Candidatus Kirkpatrickella diaphorinae TaxID=2984322 RepID=A0ABY6GH98_9PROT|nr:RNA-binding protein [Candidatus Kirkpatrickella diaphorinae]UYH50667.1 RNA-binding protein [Candidatus Kirkpatrickella diaphorinae]
MTHESKQDAPDASAPEDKHLRRCIVTRHSQKREKMLRFVVSDAGVVTPDLAGRLPGRGIWLSARRDVLETARARHLFSKAAQRSVIIPDDLYERIVLGLEMRVVQVLGLARRAGQARTGFVKCREWISSGHVGLVIHNEDASPDELRRLLSGATALPCVKLPSGTLAKAFGREHAVYAVVSRGALAQKLADAHERLTGLAGKPE